MDARRFSASSPGRLVKIEQPRKDHCFVPNEFPPDWEFAPSLWPILAEAKECLGTLNGIGQTLPNPELLLRPLQNREAISSSSIEGTFVTPQELLLYELDPREPRSGDDKKADWLEVFNYGRALQHGCKLLSELPLCNRLIADVHHTLMLGVRGANKSPGQFRKCAVQIGSSGRFIPPPWVEVERLMSNLERVMNADDGHYDPLVKSFLIHYQFEAIHPFRDGNGRVGRVLLALMIYHTLGHSMPWLYMSAFFEQFRDEYVEKLFNVSAQGEWASWLEFCLRGAIVQAKDSVRRCHQFNRLRADFQKRVDSHSPRTCQIIEMLFTSPLISITSVAKRFDVIYHTARSDLQRLAESGIVVELAESRPRSFYSPELMEIAYGEDGTGQQTPAPADEPS